MFSWKNRLTKKRDIEITIKQGKRRRGRLCHLVLWNTDPKQFPLREYNRSDIKIAVVVGKKVSKKAVQRNRLKRQTREIIKQVLKESLLRPGTFVVCTIQPNALGATFQELKDDVYALLTPRKS